MAPRTVLVTGCSSGIGLAVAVKLAQDPQQRFQVIATMRDLRKKEKLEEAAGSALGKTLSIQRLDVCSDSSVAECMESIPGGRVDVLVNNAGVGHVGPVESISVEEMKRIFETNFFGAVRMIKAVLPDMKRRQSGHIVVISSVMGLQGIVFNDVYAASKFAVEGFCESLAVQLLQFNVFVSMVEPGPVNTDFELKLMEEVSRSEFPGTDPATVRYFKDVYLPASHEIFTTLGQSPAAVAEAIVNVIGARRPAFRTQTNRLYTPLVALKYADPSGDLSVRTYYRLLFNYGTLFHLSMGALRCLTCGCFRRSSRSGREDARRKCPWPHGDGGGEMGRPSKSKNQKKERAAALQHAQQEFGTVPHSFVFHRGRVGKNVRQLIADVRKVMEPYTARALTVRKNNSLKDFVAVAGPLGVTHFLVFSKSSSSINFKLFRLPGGPTLTFKVMQYSLIKDVVSSLKRHRMHEQQFTHHPLLVLSNFGLQQIQVKLMASMFQNMFPSINVHRVNLNNIKRCLLITYNTETQLLDFRHYSVKVVPVGVSKGLKKLLQEKFPNMSRFEDISELLVKDINLSESEAEQDGTHNVLELPQAYAGRGNMKAQQSAVRLTEIGPRMTLQLIKVEEGLAQGNVLYHGLIHKMEAEVKEILARKEAKLRLKAERRQKQEANVERKRRQREAHREKSLAGIRRKRQQDGDSDAEDPGAPEQQDVAEQSEESDAEYYRQEVGEEPDRDLFPDRTKRKRSSSGAAPLRKRQRQSRPEHPAAPSPRPTPPGKRRKGDLAARDSRHRDGARKGGTGRKQRRGTKRPPREGAGPGSSRPKGRGKLLTKGKMIFRQPRRTTKGKR
ncbi:suppressor of SWI4 1 homolog [Grus americana]|nr:suppressor of SWI4 1 homolog [Grus americana]